MSIFQSNHSDLPKPHAKYGMYYIEECLRDCGYQGDLSTIKNLQRKYGDLDLNSADEYGQTVLYLASKRNHAELVDYLVRQPNVNVNAATILGNSSLLIAAWNDNNQIAEILVKNGADILAKTNSSREYHGGVSAIDIAEERGNASLASFLTNQLNQNFHPKF